MTLTLNKTTRILIDNFIDRHFSGENKTQIKEDALEIANALAESNQGDLDKLATKEDLAVFKKEIKSEMDNLREETTKIKLDIRESKYDLLKWLFASQLAMAGLIVALIKFT